MSEAQRIPVVLWITPWYPSRIHSTLGNYVERHAMAASGVSNLYLIHFVKNVENITQTESLRGPKFEGHHFFYGRNLTGKVRLYAHLIFTLFKNLGKTDIVHLNIFHETFLIAVLSKIILRKPVICTEHWTGYHNGHFRKLPVWKRLLMPWAAGFVDEFLPVTHHLGQSMEKCLNRKIHFSILPNVVDTGIFRPKLTGEKAYDFIHISTLDLQHKRPHIILRQFARLRLKFPEARLTMGGDGDIRTLKELADELNLGNSVEFFGELNSREVADRLRQARCMVLYSRFENFPCVIAEAWACGIPVISGDVGGIRYWLTDDLGILVDPDREDDLGNAMADFLLGSKKFDPTALSCYAGDHFGLKSIEVLIRDKYGQLTEK